MRASPAPQLRCAIYTRVSTEHGLEQEFNSLDNQREAAEAYIKSQAHEGWRCLPARYDDGGFSGGSLERPALQKLLTDIRARGIDVVVVYKVDRLTRSLADFAKLVELFDQHGVSFVSVTQAFNTTSSMGRLTLNVLLSFAQFEREVTGERIRDKIAASKRKGLWMGGHVPFGYRAEGRRLLVEDSEAEIVRLIFERYLAIGSLPVLQRELRERGISTRSRTLASGKDIGGVPFTNGPLSHVLRNRVYLGEINHKGQSHKGDHEAIVAPEVFAAVQEKLTANHAPKTSRALASQALLVGRIFDDRGNRMTPTHANKGGVRYRYYTSCVLAQGRKSEAGSVPRVPAPEVEALVLAALGHEAPLSPGSASEIIRTQVAKIIVREDAIEVSKPFASAEPHVLPWRPPQRARKRQILNGLASTVGSRLMRADARDKLLASVARARHWLDELVTGTMTGTHEIAAREGLSERSVRTTLSLAFLAPDIVKAASDGTLPRGVGTSTLYDPTAIWHEQLHAVSTLTQLTNGTLHRSVG